MTVKNLSILCVNKKLLCDLARRIIAVLYISLDFAANKVSVCLRKYNFYNNLCFPLYFYNMQKRHG